MNTSIQKIVGLGLLFGIHSSVVADNAETLTATLDWFKDKQITVGDIFTGADIDLAWDKLCAALTKNVVRINALDIELGTELQLPYIGTGALIDVGPPELKGKVVITCKHCSSILKKPNVRNI